MIAIYPGTFDPVTFGHVDIVKRAANLYDEVIFAIAEENYKDSLFNIEERVIMSEAAVADCNNIKVESFNGLLIDFCHEKNAKIIVRGLRANLDFEKEFQMALMNREMAPDIETTFFMTKAENQFVSSTIVKNFASLGKSMEGLVPKEAAIALREKYGV